LRYIFLGDFPSRAHDDIAIMTSYFVKILLYQQYKLIAVDDECFCMFFVLKIAKIVILRRNLYKNLFGVG